MIDLGPAVEKDARALERMDHLEVAGLIYVVVDVEPNDIFMMRVKIFAVRVGGKDPHEILKIVTDPCTKITVRPPK